jgi:hypothetical protein
MHGLIRMEQSERNARIVALRERKVRYGDIGRACSLTPQAARLIFEMHKDRQEEKEHNILRGLGMDTYSYHVMARLTGVKKPTLIDLQTFIKSHDDWKLCIRRARGGGPATARRVEDFARAHGITS